MFFFTFLVNFNKISKEKVKTYDYRGLLEILKKNNLKKSDLVSKFKISSRTIAEISKGEKISKAVINYVYF